MLKLPPDGIPTRGTWGKSCLLLMLAADRHGAGKAGMLRAIDAEFDRNGPHPLLKKRTTEWGHWLIEVRAQIEALDTPKKCDDGTETRAQLDTGAPDAKPDEIGSLPFDTRDAEYDPGEPAVSG